MSAEIFVSPERSNGARLVAADGRTLPLRETRLAAEAGGGLARTRLVQRFANPFPEPLTVTYQLPVPPEAAVVGFSFRAGERTIRGEIDRRAAARERFEHALARGHTAALLEHDRDSLFDQEIGNLAPGAELLAEILLDQPLRWVDGGWEWRFPTTLAPRYLGEPGRVPDAERIVVDVAADPLPPRLHVALRIRDALAPNAAPASPSHALRCTAGAGGIEVALAAEGGAPLDRDVVVGWAVARTEVEASLVTARPPAEHPHAVSAYGLLTLVPPVAERQAPLARDLIVLLDTSGSMEGAPLAHARAAVAALVRSLRDQDRLEMIAFSMKPERWSPAPQRATEVARELALAWLDAREAGGGTEMGTAIAEALRPLDGIRQRQVVLVTDGLIGFEQELVREVLAGLPAACRLHTVGVGSAPNRALTLALARAGRGTETLVGLDEDPRAAAERIVAATNAPLVTELELSGPALVETAPARLPDLYRGAPARIAVALRPEGGALGVRGRTAAGAWRCQLAVPSTLAGVGPAQVVTLFGRERVADLEMRIAAGEDPAELDSRIEADGLAFRIATRLTSWVALDSQASVDPTVPVRRERIPHELPHWMSRKGIGLHEGALTAELFGSPFDDPYDTPLFLSKKASPPRATGEQRTAAQRAPLRGRITATLDGWLVVEIEWAGGEWSPPDRIVATWADGTEHEAELDREQGTRAGAVAKGLTVRLRLRLRLPADAPVDPPRTLRLERGHEVELVELR